jgi:hypothetical protein
VDARCSATCASTSLVALTRCQSKKLAPPQSGLKAMRLLCAQEID